MISDATLVQQVEVNGAITVPLSVTAKQIADAATILELYDYEGNSLYNPDDSHTFIEINSVADLMRGDKINLMATVMDINGKNHTINDLSTNLLSTENQTTAYSFDTRIACPFSLDELVGTYSVVADPFGAGINNDIRKVIVEAGPGENQITIKDIFGHFAAGAPVVPNNYDIVVDIVNPVNGELKIEFQDAWHYSLFGTDASVASQTRGKGLVFSCLGLIELRLSHYNPERCCLDGVSIYNLKKD